jgi:hypothetical protein
MALNLYESVYASGRVPQGWSPIVGGVRKYRVHNDELRRYLKTLLPGRWVKVIKKGVGGEVHYFEHASGQVAGVKFFL